MNHVIWTLPNGLQLPMIKPDEGPMLVLTKAAAGAFGCSHKVLAFQILRHADRLSENCTSKCGAIEFLRQNREVFGLRYIRQDMRLLTDADFLYLSAHIQTEQARGLTQAYIQFVIEQTRKDTVTMEEYRALQEHYLQLEGRISKLEEEQEERRAADPFVSKSASLAGSLLHAQRGTKNIRSMN